MDMLKGFELYTKLGKERLKHDQLYEYNPNGGSGMPSLLINMPVDYVRVGVGDGISTEVMSNKIALARVACLFLDFDVGEPGAWGPECIIKEFTTQPEGKLEKSIEHDAHRGDYKYTPPKVGTDKLRFILGNGAGNQTDVTINLIAYDFTGARRPDEGSRALVQRGFCWDKHFRLTEMKARLPGTQT